MKKEQQQDSDSDSETQRVTADRIKQLAPRCGLSARLYEQRVLLPAIRSAEQEAGLRNDVPELHQRAMRAAATARYRTARGLKRWIDNVIWRWMREAQRRGLEAARATRKEPPAKPPAVAQSHEATTTEKRRRHAEADQATRVSMEREALERAAHEREVMRLAGIEQPRRRVRHTVLGAEAAARAENRQDTTAEWATERWRQLEKASQEACWAILRPLLGLKPGSYNELIQRKRRTDAEVRAGLWPRKDQQLLARRKQRRAARVHAWTRLGDRIRRTAAQGQNTAHEAIRAAITPRQPMP